MGEDQLLVVLREYGWLAIVVYFLIRELWPAVRDRVLPQYAEERKEKMLASKAQREREKAERERERERLKNLEERQVVAFERVSQAVEEMSKTMAISNERLSQAMVMLGEHDRIVRDAIEDMKERVGNKGRKAVKDEP